jgi:PPOX class probable F420-dependent enzyme
VDASEARALFAGAPVARLATVGRDGRPHLVPITFALLDGDLIAFAIDAVKRKRTVALQRLRNIRAEPRVAVLADHYSDDWSQLWWVRADGTARIAGPGAEPGLRATALAALRARYPAYRSDPLAAAVVFVAVERWSGWTAG